MSPEALTAERAYQDLRRAIIHGHFAPGVSLNVHAIAQEHAMSISPVRDALHRMVGERMLIARPNGGFEIMSMSLDEAADLYRWHSFLILGATRADEPIRLNEDLIRLLDQIDPTDAEAIVSATAEFFYNIAEGSDNVEHLLAIRVAGDRLTQLRHRESVFRNREEELRRLILIATAGGKKQLRSAIARYHQRRLRTLDAIFQGPTSL